jgi:hypothetical protein
MSMPLKFSGIYAPSKISWNLRAVKNFLEFVRCQKIFYDLHVVKFFVIRASLKIFWNSRALKKYSEYARRQKFSGTRRQ